MYLSLALLLSIVIPVSWAPTFLGQSGNERRLRSLFIPRTSRSYNYHFHRQISCIGLRECGKNQNQIRLQPQRALRCCGWRFSCAPLLLSRRIIDGWEHQALELVSISNFKSHSHIESETLNFAWLVHVRYFD